MRGLHRRGALACLALLAWGLGDSSARAQDHTGEKYALLIGVKNYPRGALRDLRYAEADMEELARVLVDAGYRRENIRVMTQKAAATDPSLNPTLANLRTAIKGWAQGRGENDSLLLAFAGHGVQFRGSTEPFLCPADARLADPRNTLLAVREIKELLGQSRARCKLMLVDACRNDPLVDMSRGAGTAKLPVVKLKSDFRPDRAADGGALVLSSCSRGQKAYEHEALKHSVFYHFVLQGLKGTADGNKDGKVTLNELCDYLNANVPKFTLKEFQVEQQPELAVEGGGLRGAISVALLRRIPVLPAEFLPAVQAKLKGYLAQGYQAFTGNLSTSFVAFRLSENATFPWRITGIKPKDEVCIFVVSQGSRDVRLRVAGEGTPLVRESSPFDPAPALLFQSPKAGAYSLRVSNPTRDHAEAVMLLLLRRAPTPLQDMRYLRVVNKSATAIRVYLRYDAKTQNGSWFWYHSGKGANPVVYTIGAGQSADLFDQGWRVKARRVRIWAYPVQGTGYWLRARDTDVWLARETYRADDIGVYTYTFNR